MREDFDRLLDALAEAGKKVPESEVDSLVAEAVAQSRRKVGVARAGRKAKPRTR
jgi:hypothetical protein